MHSVTVYVTLVRVSEQLSVIAHTKGLDDHGLGALWKNDAFNFRT